ncbi:hypothetical protein [Arcticibacter eurypsychrophilus]|uniref:hypothetical protein n=1 Tax=Arcticibacter eurypsychrophilus TaxID=1434752 RepID=UPI00084D2925|nr:hypothetical protein [Arcticibacter eurypsychrophilus]
MKIQLIPILLIGLFLTGCSSSSDIKSKGQTHVIEENHNHGDSSHLVALKNGNKWIVNKEMLSPIDHTHTIIHDFVNQEKKDYKLLAANLLSDANLIISSCTMKGESHDELHKWLMPYMAEVNELSKAEDNAAAAQKFENIQSAWDTFNQYFQ